MSIYLSIYTLYVWRYTFVSPYRIAETLLSPFNYFDIIYCRLIDRQASTQYRAMPVRYIFVVR